ncbi:hypothetical protein [Terrabacter sp. NPDC080008]|uniref:hypothetical protein n=1 Tax=Terrabacter sp. NPDC080008 TaxID=3155176 RepID=UPI00344E8BB6
MSTAHEMTTHGSGPFAVERRLLSVGEVAARLEHRLYASGETCQDVDEGCAYAVCHGLAGVVVLPGFVATAGARLAGTSVGLVTIPGWRSGGAVESLCTSALLAEAGSLADQGATDLGMLADADRLVADGGQRLVHDVSALVEAMQSRNVRVRVILDTDGLTPHAAATSCELLGSTGAWLVQGGSWRGARTGLSRIQLMRADCPMRWD